VVQFSSDYCAVCYVPGTSGFGPKNTDTGLEAVTNSEFFTMTRQVAPLNCTPTSEVCCCRLPCCVRLASLVPAQWLAGKTCFCVEWDIKPNSINCVLSVSSVSTYVLSLQRVQPATPQPVAHWTGKLVHIRDVVGGIGQCLMYGASVTVGRQSSVLPPANWHPSPESLAVHNGVWLWIWTVHCTRGRSLLSSIAWYLIDVKWWWLFSVHYAILSRAAYCQQ